MAPENIYSYRKKKTVFMKKMAANGKNVYLVKLGPKSLADGRQDICKDEESNLGPAAGY